MTHGPEHHIEHAEHAQHAAHDPFDKRVTVSIAIVAAVLAGVTMMGHRAHNETLRLQGEALRLQTEASILSTETANQWAFYQSKKIRDAVYGAFLDFAALMELTDKTKDPKKGPIYWQNQVKDYAKELPEMMAEARKREARTKAMQEEAKGMLNLSHDVHARADRFDYGELGLQLGVVLCSLAILTKGRSFWFAGLGCAALGLLVALSGVFGLFMGHH